MPNHQRQQQLEREDEDGRDEEGGEDEEVEEEQGAKEGGERLEYEHGMSRWSARLATVSR